MESPASERQAKNLNGREAAKNVHEREEALDGRERALWLIRNDIVVYYILFDRRVQDNRRLKSLVESENKKCWG